MSGFQEYLEKAANQYHNQLIEILDQKDGLTHGAMRYLDEDHGIGYKAIIEFKLGYVNEPLPQDTLPGRKFHDCISFPYLAKKQMAGIRFRKLTGEGQKFHQPPGQHPTLYNVNAFHQHTDFICITEGEPDTISCQVNLGFPTVGIPGAEQWKGNAPTWAPLFKDFQKVFVLQHGDIDKEIQIKGGGTKVINAGATLTKQIEHSLTWRAFVIRCPDGEDVSSMVVAGRSDELRNQILAEIEE
jgi:hypothetical protein